MADYINHYLEPLVGKSYREVAEEIEEIASRHDWMVRLVSFPPDYQYLNVVLDKDGWILGFTRG